MDARPARTKEKARRSRAFSNSKEQRLTAVRRQVFLGDARRRAAPVELTVRGGRRRKDEVAGRANVTRIRRYGNKTIRSHDQTCHVFRDLVATSGRGLIGRKSLPHRLKILRNLNLISVACDSKFRYLQTNNVILIQTNRN